jgi:hypothetical protein
LAQTQKYCMPATHFAYLRLNEVLFFFCRHFFVISLAFFAVVEWGPISLSFPLTLFDLCKQKHAAAAARSLQKKEGGLLIKLVAVAESDKVAHLANGARVPNRSLCLLLNCMRSIG